MTFTRITASALPFVLVALGFRGCGGQASKSAPDQQALTGYKVGVESVESAREKSEPIAIVDREAPVFEGVPLKPGSQGTIALAQRSVLRAPQATPPKIPRTPDGRPDFQGTWVNNTATPLERLPEFADKPFFTPEEARAYEQSGYQVARLLQAVRGDRFELEAAGGDIDSYEPGRVLPDLRTSLIIDPPDGRVPALTEDAKRRAAERDDRYVKRYADTARSLLNGERCLSVGNTAVPPLVPMFYGNHSTIVQSPGEVVISSEMVHDARIISLSRRSHVSPAIRQWKGDSIGHWEGDTLVVHTINFTDQTPFRGSGSNLELIERFTFADANPNMIIYEFTVNDPDSFVRPWTARSAIFRSNELMVEYACHEGNYSLPNILRGARATEKAAEK